MTTERLHHVQIEDRLQVGAKRAARGDGLTVANYFAALLRGYATGPAPSERPAEPTPHLVVTKVALDDDTWDEAAIRARLEGKSLSEKLAELVRADVTARAEAGAA